MRGGKSLLVLLVIALGLGAYIYFVEAKKDLTDSSTKKEKVFAIDQSKIEEIEVRAASGETTTLKKDGTVWQIVAPATLEADQSEVSSLLTTLESLEIQRVLDQKPADLKPFELNPPRFTVAVRMTGDTAARRINVGSKTPTGADLYATIEGQPRLVLLSAYIDDSLNKTTFSFREKSVLKFAHEGVDSLTLEPAGTPAVSLAKKGNDWRLVTGGVDAAAVRDCFGPPNVSGSKISPAFARAAAIETQRACPKGSTLAEHGDQ